MFFVGCLTYGWRRLWKRICFIWCATRKSGKCGLRKSGRIRFLIGSTYYSYKGDISKVADNIINRDFSTHSTVVNFKNTESFNPCPERATATTIALNSEKHPWWILNDSILLQCPENWVHIGLPCAFNPEFYRTSFALPLIISMAPSWQAVAHKPQPLHLSSSIWMIFRIISILSCCGCFLHLQAYYSILKPSCLFEFQQGESLCKNICLFCGTAPFLPGLPTMKFCPSCTASVQRKLILSISVDR